MLFTRNCSPIRRRPRPILEELESRTLLSTSGLQALTANPQAVLNSAAQASVSLTPQGRPGGGGGGGVTNPNPVGYQPSQIQSAYGFNQITFSNGTIKGDGSGQTIAIVDAYNDPNIQKDLKTFDSEWSLPAGNVTVVNQTGGSKLPKSNSGWSLEISLDVEWAHAMAPGAKILLVEASTSSLSDLLTAVSYAGQHASVVSMSWGSGEFSSETAYDSYFNKPGVTFVASSGDNGAPASWPAVSPNVVAVGGTTLSLNSSGGYGSETGWSGSGGGISAYESLPSYQPGTYSNGSTTGTSTMRLNPDVAYGADPGTLSNPTGFAVYDTVSYYGQTGWFDVGGTSAGAPQWSALVAIADQGRALASHASLSGVSQTLPALYSMASSDFHDITSGSSTGTPSYTAGPGYDLVTGRGTPYANLVVNALVSATSTGGVGGLVAMSHSTATSTSAKKAAAVGDPSQSQSPSDSVALVFQALAASDPTILIQPAQTTIGTTIFPFGTASVLSSAFSSTASLQASLTLNNPSQASSFSATAFGLQFFAPAPRSISSTPADLGNYLSPFRYFSPDAVPQIGAHESEDLSEDGPLALPRTLRISMIMNDIDLEPALAIPTKAANKVAPACDAFFADEAGMALLAEEDLAKASEEKEPSLRPRATTLALLGVLAGSLWIVPTTAEERRKRRFVLV